MMATTQETYPCQGNDDCRQQLPENSTRCVRCGLPTCEDHSILVNGVRWCEICIATRFDQQRSF